MAYAFGSVGAEAFSESTPPDHNPGEPSGASALELLLIAAYSRPGNAITTPTGWTDLATTGTNRVKLMGRIADNTADDTPTVTSASGGLCVSQMARFTGAPATITGIVNGSVATNFSSAVDINTPALSTPGVDNCLIIVVGTKENDLGASTAPPTGFTLIDDVAIDGVGSDAQLSWAYQIQTTAASVSSSKFDFASADTSDSRSLIVALVAGDAAVTVSDVDTDETITADQTNVVVTGTGFGSSQGAGTVTIRQGSTSVAQTIDSWFDTSIQFDVVFDSTTDLKYGAATLRVTEDGGAYGELAITISPQTGYVYTDLLTPNTTSAYRLSASLDLAAGDQVRGRGLNSNPFPTGHTIETDATVTLDSGVTGTAFEASAWAASDSTWGSWARIDVDPNPITVSPPVGALTLSGLAPSVTLGDNQRIAVPVGSLTVTAYAPTVAITTGVQTVVPPVTGLTRTAAQAAIEAAGLVEAPFFYFDSAAVNTVLSQTPAAGTVVEEDSTVEIRVSVGTEASSLVQRVGRTKFRTVQNRTKFRVA